MFMLKIEDDGTTVLDYQGKEYRGDTVHDVSDLLEEEGFVWEDPILEVLAQAYDLPIPVLE